MEPRRGGRVGRRRRPLRLEAVRPGRALPGRGRAAAVTLARQVWLASIVLALIVGSAFAALVVAVSAQREAIDREQRSRIITASALRLQAMVSDIESNWRGLTLTANDRFRQPYRQATRQLPERTQALQELVADDPA